MTARHSAAQPRPRRQGRGHTRVLDDGERAPPGGSAEAGAAETDDDTETPEQMLK